MENMDDNDSLYSGGAVSTSGIIGYTASMNSVSVELNNDIKGYTNETYAAYSYSDRVDPSNNMQIINENSEVINVEKINDQSLPASKPKSPKDSEEVGFEVNRNERVDFWKVNPWLEWIFKMFGIYVLKWDGEEKKYKPQKTMFILSYIFWFFWPLAGLLLAYFGSQYLGIESDITDSIQSEEETSLMNLSLIILLLGLTPAIQTYTIKVFSENLPTILKDINRLSQGEFGNYKEGTMDINLLKMYSESRFKCTVNCTSCKSPKDLIYNRLPEFTFTIAGIAFLASTISSIVQSTTSGSVFEEWYFLVMITFYLVMPVFTTWFCIIFIEWHRKVYDNIHTEINKLIESEIERSENEPNKSVVHKLLNNCLSLTAVVDSKITDKDYLRNLNKYSDQIQDIFSQLSQGVLKYALGINMLVFLATSTFSAYRMLTDVSYIYYIFPLSVAVVHICIICARCSDLMDVHGDVLAELKKLLHHYEEQKNNKTDQEEENNKTDRKKKSKKHINDLHKLRANLYDSPPQVVILGSFVVDYGMLSTIIGFILSYALVINELFEEDTLICNAASITTATSTAAVTNSTPPSVATTTPINSTGPDPLSGGAIAGIVIGSIAGVGLIVGSVAFCYIKKKLCFNKLPA